MAISERNKRYWGVVAPTMPANVVAQSAQQQEAMGLEGTFAAQIYGPPFIPLAAAATTTTRLLLASGIALAFVRSPFETAMAAMDLDRMSGGRFILGLGSSIRAWSEGFFGMPYGKPVAHLREAVEVIRLLIAKSQRRLSLGCPASSSGGIPVSVPGVRPLVQLLTATRKTALCVRF